MQHKQDMPILGKEDNASENFGAHEDEESILEEQDIQEHERNLVGKRLDTGNRARDGLSGHTPQNGFLATELSSSLKEVRFSEQEFPAGKTITNIKYHQPNFLNNNPFYPFND